MRKADPFVLTDVLEALNAGGVVVTCNDTVARDLQIRYSIYRRDCGDSVWERPRILSFRRFAIQAWESCWPTRQLLNPVHELALYKSIVDGSDAGRQLISSTTAARAARRAGGMVCTHRIDVTDPAFQASTETQVFASWFGEVRQRLEEMGWTTQDCVVDELIAFIRDGRYRCPPRLLRYGFIEATTQQNDLFSTLAEFGTVLADHVGSPDGSSGPETVRPISAQEEVNGCARRIAAILHDYLDRPNDAPRIGVLVPNIEDYRLRIDSVFAAVLAPYLILPSANDSPVAWRYTSGEVLANQDVVNAALTALQVRRFDNDCSLVTRFLLNKRFGNGPEYYARAEIDYRLRKDAGRRVALGHVLALAESEGQTRAPMFAERLRGLLDHIEHNDGSAAPSDWVARYRQRLTILGWPSGTLSPQSVQAIRAWDESLRLFSGMDRQLGQISAELAFFWLRELCGTREVAMRVRYYQPIEIIPWTDSPGLRFDYAFVLGASASQLPFSVDLSPFLPPELALQHDVPLSTPESCLAQGRRLTEAIQILAARVVWSCPMFSDDGSPVAPSPLISAWPESESPAVPASAVFDRILAAGVKTALPADDPIPRVIDPDAEGIRGGVEIVASYAVMPFAAFARHRLGVRPFPSPEPGLSALAQGNVIHAVLEAFWKETVTRSALRALDETSLSRRVAKAIDFAIESKHLLPQWRIGRSLATLEKRRLTTLIGEWLRLEATRDDEFAVVGCEVPVRTHIHGLSVDVRLDRIDRVSTSHGDRYVIIDYKSGAHVDPSGWNADSLTQPQLPFYASCLDLTPVGVGHVDGIAFGHVAEAVNAFHARLNWAGYLVPVEKGKATAISYWGDMQNQWRTAIEQALANFLGGDGKAFYEGTLPLPYADLITFLRRDPAP
jgi:ATP-dependent helicase/nuclease subunit B